MASAASASAASASAASASAASASASASERVKAVRLNGRKAELKVFYLEDGKEDLTCYEKDSFRRVYTARFGNGSLTEDQQNCMDEAARFVSIFSGSRTSEVIEKATRDDNYLASKDRRGRFTDGIPFDTDNTEWGIALSAHPKRVPDIYKMYQRQNQEYTSAKKAAVADSLGDRAGEASLTFGGDTYYPENEGIVAIADADDNMVLDYRRDKMSRVLLEPHAAPIPLARQIYNIFCQGSDRDIGGIYGMDGAVKRVTSNTTRGMISPSQPDYSVCQTFVTIPRISAEGEVSFTRQKFAIRGILPIAIILRPSQEKSITAQWRRFIGIFNFQDQNVFLSDSMRDRSKLSKYPMYCWYMVRSVLHSMSADVFRVFGEVETPTVIDEVRRMIRFLNYATYTSLEVLRLEPEVYSFFYQRATSFLMAPCANDRIDEIPESRRLSMFAWTLVTAGINISVAIRPLLVRFCFNILRMYRETDGGAAKWAQLQTIADAVREIRSSDGDTDTVTKLTFDEIFERLRSMGLLGDLFNCVKHGWHQHRGDLMTAITIFLYFGGRTLKQQCDLMASHFGQLPEPEITKMIGRVRELRRAFSGDITNTGALASNIQFFLQQMKIVDADTTEEKAYQMFVEMFVSVLIRYDAHRDAQPSIDDVEIPSFNFEFTRSVATDANGPVVPPPLDADTLMEQRRHDLEGRLAAQYGVDTRPFRQTEVGAPLWRRYRAVLHCGSTCRLPDGEIDVVNHPTTCLNCGDTFRDLSGTIRHVKEMIRQAKVLSESDPSFPHIYNFVDRLHRDSVRSDFSPHCPVGCGTPFKNDDSARAHFWTKGSSCYAGLSDADRQMMSAEKERYDKAEHAYNERSKALRQEYEQNLAHSLREVRANIDVQVAARQAERERILGNIADADAAAESEAVAATTINPRGKVTGIIADACVICLTDFDDSLHPVMFLQCGHAATCSSCSDHLHRTAFRIDPDLQEGEATCPLCRSKITCVLPSAH